MENFLEKTTIRDQKIAKLSLPKFRETSQRFKVKKERTIKLKIQGSDQDALEIPAKAFALLFDIVKEMALGKSITLIPSDTEVSTQKAADILNVSRPHLVKLLEEGVIPFKKVGAHRRIAIKDLTQYETSLKENRNKKLAFLTEQAQALNLGY